jgi:hypothetical protein
VFCGLVALLMTGVVLAVLESGLPEWFRMSATGFYAVWLTGMVLGVYAAYRKDPRGLSYGPNEYIEESRLAHERHMEALKVQRQ